MNDDRTAANRRGRSMAPLDPALSPGEREFLERLRSVAATAGDTLAQVSSGLEELSRVRGLDDRAPTERAHSMAAGVPDLSKMLSGKRSARPEVIRGLHILAALRKGGPQVGDLLGSSPELSSLRLRAAVAEAEPDIAVTQRLYTGWVRERDRGIRLQLATAQQQSAELRHYLADAERRADELAVELSRARLRHTETVAELARRSIEITAVLGRSRGEVRRLADEVRALNERISLLETALAEAWRVVVRHVEDHASLIEWALELAGRLAEPED